MPLRSGPAGPSPPVVKIGIRLAEASGRAPSTLSTALSLNVFALPVEHRSIRLLETLSLNQSSKEGSGEYPRPNLRNGQHIIGKEIIKVEANREMRVGEVVPNDLD